LPLRELDDQRHQNLPYVRSTLSVIAAIVFRRIVRHSRIHDRKAEPLIRDLKGNLVPFTKERFENYISARPSFYIEDTSERGGKLIRPTPRDYARCTQALLEAAEEQHRLRPVIADFVDWFAESITSDARFEALKRKFDKLFPGERRKSDAFLALTVFWGERVEDEFLKHRARLDAAAERATKKRKRRQKK